MKRSIDYTDTGPSALPVLFFIHGWPDSALLWRQQIPYFKDRFRCVAVTLPAFKEHGEPQDFPVVVEELVELIQRLRHETKGELVIVGHDWGAFLTYLIDQKYPTAADRLITLDVGGHFKPASLGHALFMVGYQWYLVAAYLIGKLIPFLGNSMTRAFSKIAKTPRRGDVNARMNYLYFYFWRARFCKRYRAALPIRYKPSKPMLYLYGNAKKYHFHSEKWLKMVSSVSGSDVVAIPKCHHWFMLQDAKSTNESIERFLTKRPTAP